MARLLQCFSDLTLRDVKWKLYQCFEYPKHVTHIIVHLIVFLVVVASLTISLILETSNSLDPALISTLFAIEFTLAIYFSLELMLRLWVIGIVQKYSGCKGRLRYMISLNFLLDVTILGSTICMCIIIEKENRALKRQEIENLGFVHLLRFLHLDRSAYSWNLFKRVIITHRTELTAVAILASITLFFIATAVLFIDEMTEMDSGFTGFGSSIYFTVVMYLTIGYGDLVPTGWYFKVFTSLMCWMAISLLGLTSSVLSVGLALLVQDKKLKKHRERIKPVAAELIEHFYRCRLMKNKFHKIPFYKNTLIKRMVYNQIPKYEEAEHPAKVLQDIQASLKWIRNLSKMSLKLTKQYSEREADSTNTKEYDHECQKELESHTSRPHQSRPTFHMGLSEVNIPDLVESTNENQLDISAQECKVKQPYKERHYQLAIIFVWKMKFFRAKKRFKDLQRSPDLVDVSQQVNENELAQLQRLNQLQYGIEKLIGVHQNYVHIARADSIFGSGGESKELPILTRLNNVHAEVQCLGNRTEKLLFSLDRFKELFETHYLKH